MINTAAFTLIVLITVIIAWAILISSYLTLIGV